MGKRYLLDTNAISKAFRNLLPEPSLELIRSIIGDQAIISVITRIELIGFDPKDDLTANTFALFVQQATELGLSEPVILKTIELRKKVRIKLPEAIIAATALVHSLTLVSDNDVDFLRVPKLKYINPARL
ncbi:MAG: type II toxin-antitoxin system VapC family toxin [Cytophagaceae bacterium]|nr:MAG: type II toxin-antitoxin system VapC family toxin [Cytophagaceae bacterium]